MIEGAVRELKSRLSGQLLMPADEGYDAARSVFNTMIDPASGAHRALRER